MNITGKYPLTRMRRMRSNEFSRTLNRETTLSAANLIYPMFVIEGDNISQPIKAMPNIFRMSIDNIVLEAEQVYKLGIPAIILFPVINPEQKTATAEEAYNPQGLIQTCIRAIKNSVPNIGIITDIALDPYTTHGHDGVIDKFGYVLNEQTIEVLVQQAISHAAAGADILAPSDMMDGRIGVIRTALEAEGFNNTKLLSYAAKYASSFYGPFREAVGSSSALKGADKLQYQMDPANTNEALREVALDIQEGADMVMVKPGMPYLDVIYRIKQQFKLPTLAYQVSGEYSTLMAAAANGWIDERHGFTESLLCLRRAGADAIISYYSKSFALQLVDK